MAREWTKEEDEKILRMHRDEVPLEQIAKAMKSTVSAVRHRVYFYRDKEKPDGDGENQVEVVYEDDSGRIAYIGDKIKTVDELVAYAKIDLQIWEVVEVKINSWEVAGKKKHGQGCDGKWKPESLWKTPLRQISVKLRRRAPKHVQDGIRDLLANVPVWKRSIPKGPKFKRSADHMLEISLYDAHFGKLCWEQETGDNYDLSIAQSDYEGAVEDLMGRLSGFKIEKIMFPVGHDFFHVNSWAKMTARGTSVDSTDDRVSKVFTAGCDAVISSILKCIEVAPVEVVWVPGNHDPETSWYMCELIRRVFDGNDNVKVDVSPTKRKYREYGVSLIGYDHGETTSLDSLPMIMANEASDAWSRCVFRHYRVGHFHKKKQIKWIGTDTFHGVDVTVLPSLSGMDKWHYDNGFIGNHRTAESALWNRDSGYVGSFSVEARSALAKRKRERLS